MTKAPQPCGRRRTTRIPHPTEFSIDMPNVLRKRRPTASEAGIEPSICTNPGPPHNPTLTISHSEETATHRCYEGGSRCRKRVVWLVPSPPIVFGRDQCHYQTLRRALLSNIAPPLLTDLSQESKDVENELGDLIPWLAKLKDSITTAGDNGNHEEENRRDQLIRCALHPRCFAHSSSPFVDPWETSRAGPRRCWRKGRWPESSIKLKILEWSSNLSRTFGRRFSFIR